LFKKQKKNQKIFHQFIAGPEEVGPVGRKAAAVGGKGWCFKLKKIK
jgi:hypothetical protein